MLDNNPRFNSLGKDIWVGHDFVHKDELRFLINKINSYDDSEWNCSHPEGHGVLYLRDHVEKFTARVQDLLPPPLFVHGIGGVNRLITGQKHGIHSDSDDFLKVRELNKNLNKDLPFKIVDDNIYGVVIYLNDDYEGGEIFYTKQNITYKPIAGDIIIHSSDKHCEHGVNPVKTKNRYSISTSIRKKIKINVDNV